MRKAFADSLFFVVFHLSFRLAEIGWDGMGATRVGLACDGAKIGRAAK